jgi:hypothetical protein
MTNKEKEALLKEVLEAPDVPRKVAMKHILGHIERMQPETQDMRDYLMAIFSAETHAESNAIQRAWYAKMTPAQGKAFAKAFYRCCMNDLQGHTKVKSPTIEEFA